MTPARPEADVPTIPCEACGGTGFNVIVIPVERCCGNPLPSGECCAAAYGGANVGVDYEYEQEQCSLCRGTGREPSTVQPREEPKP